MPSPKGNNLSIRLLDSKKNPGSASTFLKFADTDTVAGIRGAIQTYLNLVSAVCGAQIVAARYELEISPTGAALTKTPTTGAFLEMGARLVFTNTGAGNNPYSFYLPAVEPSLVASGKLAYVEGNSVDLLADVMENGATGGTPLAGSTGGFFTDREQHVLGPTASAAWASHKKSRQDGRNSLTSEG